MSSDDKQTILLRKIDAENPEDLKCLKKIDNDPKVSRWMSGGKLSGKKELTEFIQGSNDSKVWGVALVNKTDGKQGKLQGWIKFDRDDPKRLKKTKKGRTLLSKKTEVWETSFAKLSNAPRHIMSRCLIKACKKMLSPKRGKIAITAYVSRENLRSIFLLERCGFAPSGQALYSSKAKKSDFLYLLNKGRLRYAKRM